MWQLAMVVAWPSQYSFSCGLTLAMPKWCCTSAFHLDSKASNDFSISNSFNRRLTRRCTRHDTAVRVSLVVGLCARGWAEPSVIIKEMPNEQPIENFNEIEWLNRY